MAAALVDAGYKWRVVARDGSLNTASSVVRSFTVDTVAVRPPDLIAPGDNAFLNTRTPFFDWASPVGIVKDYLLQVVVSGDAFVTGPFAINLVITGSQTQFQTTANLAERRYQWRVLARDLELNTGASDTRFFTVDLTPPTKPGIPVRVSTGENETEKFTWQRSVDPPPPPPGGAGDESGVEFYKVEVRRALDNLLVLTGVVQDTACGPVTCEFTVTDKLVPGNYIVVVIALDRATNSNTVVSAPFFEGRKDLVQNLAVVDPVFGNTVIVTRPKFRWSPPLDVVEGTESAVTYEVAITGDPVLAPQYVIPFTAFTDTNFFTSECFRLDGSPIGSGVACVGISGAGDTIQITVVSGRCPRRYSSTGCPAGSLR